MSAENKGPDFQEYERFAEHHKVTQTIFKEGKKQLPDLSEEEKKTFFDSVKKLTAEDIIKLGGVTNLPE